MTSEGRINNAQLKNLKIGMKDGEVRSMLGLPSRSVSPSGVLTPTEAFESLGSEFRFPDVDLDDVWVYLHSTNDRRLYCLGFKDCQLATVWKMTDALR